jgi:hypothetical protein
MPKEYDARVVTRRSWWVWAIVAAVVSWVLIAGELKYGLLKKHEACMAEYDKNAPEMSLRPALDGLDACLREAGVDRHGNPTKGWVRFVILPTTLW